MSRVGIARLSPYYVDCEVLTMSVQTVLGPIRREDMGVTTAHEHVFIELTAFFEERPLRDIPDPATRPVTMDVLGQLARDPYALRDNLRFDDYETQKRELLYFARAGGRTVVDATTIGIGRDPERLRRMSCETGLHIVMGAGYYVGSTHSPEVRASTPEQLAANMVRELNEGMDGTDVRAGIIGEIGVSEVFDESERNVLRGAAIAQRETGAPIHVHINPWTVNGLEAARILIDAGVSPDRVCIDHIDMENRVDYIEKLLDMGCYVEFDNFGKESYIDREARRPGYSNFNYDTARVELLKHLIDTGRGDKILLSCDVCLKTLLRTYGGWGYDHILVNVLPMMDEAGIKASDIDRLLIDNPANFFDK